MAIPTTCIFHKHKVSDAPSKRSVGEVAIPQKKKGLATICHYPSLSSNLGGAAFHLTLWVALPFTSLPLWVVISFTFALGVDAFSLPLVLVMYPFLFWVCFPPCLFGVGRCCVSTSPFDLHSGAVRLSDLRCSSLPSLPPRKNVPRGRFRLTLEIIITIMIVVYVQRTGGTP